MSALEAGFIFSGNIGSGVLLVKRDDGSWSPPLAIGSLGVGWGFIAGAEAKDVVIFLFDNYTVETLSGDAQAKLGGQISLTLGPIGREFDSSFHASNKGLGTTIAFTYSKGVFGGVSVEGAILGPRSACNGYVYGNASSKQIAFDEGFAYPQGKGIEEMHEKLAILQRGKQIVEPSTSSAGDDIVPNLIEVVHKNTRSDGNEARTDNNEGAKSEVISTSDTDRKEELLAPEDEMLDELIRS